MVLRGSAETPKTPDLFMKLLSEDLGKPVQKREIVWCGYGKEIMKPISQTANVEHSLG